MSLEGLQNLDGYSLGLFDVELAGLRMKRLS